MKTTARCTIIAMSVTALAFLTTPAFAQSDPDRIAELEEQISVLAQQIGELHSEVTTANQVAIKATQSATQWKDATSVTHMSGYASADYVSVENGPAAFGVNFNPMFHFLYDSKILWEAELEFEATEDGGTNIGLEYSTIDWFISDNLTLIAGKFLSPIGNFRQNQHPSWINKLPSAPPGFGHDGAAPVSEIGLQLRGVTIIGSNSRITYAAYLGNGPKIESDDGEIHSVEAEGFASDADGEMVFGGRIVFLPIPALELAISGATGDVAVVENDHVELSGDPTRGYSVFGFDASYRWNNLDLRAEFVSQEVDPQPLSVAPEGAKWETWFAQAAYKFGDKWEGVVRYTDFTSPHADDTQEQLAFGFNYLITPSAMVKFAYESNKGELGEKTDADRWIVQFAYGY